MAILIRCLKFVLTLLTFGLATVSEGIAQDRVISVIGVGEVAATPDMAALSVSVGASAVRATEAVGQVAARTQAILSDLAALGIAERDIQTRQISLSPIWDQNRQTGEPRRLTGYAARSALSIALRDLSLLGKLLDTVVENGATEFGGLRFMLQDRATLEAEARAAAVRDANRRAQQIAKAAGVDLGPVLSITEPASVQPGPRAFGFAAERSSAELPIAAGEIAVSVQIAAVYAIN